MTPRKRTLCLFASIALTLLLSPPLARSTLAHEASPKFVPLLKQCLAKTVSNMNASEADYSECFSKDFIQTVNGEPLPYTEMVSKRLKAQNKEIKSFRIDFETLIEEGEQVAAAFKVEIQKSDGKTVRLLANAMVRFKDGKILRLNEVVHRLEPAGEKAR